MRWILCFFVFVSCKPDAETCKKACLNFAKLSHDEQLAKDMRGLDAEAAKQLTLERDKVWAEIASRAEDRGRENCEKRCTTDSRRADAECMANATTAVAARACIGQ